MTIAIPVSESPAKLVQPSGERIELPVVQGWQSSNFYWMTNIRLSELAEYFRPFFERERDGKKRPLTLAQRTLNTSRVEKVAQYILKGCLPHESYVLPPVTVTVDIPQNETFEFCGVEFEDDVGISSLEAFPPEFGTLSLPASATLWLADGQHRIRGAIEAHLRGEPLVQQETLGEMLIPDADGRRRKQMFLDINKHAAKPSQSIIALFDSGDPYCEIARAVLMGVPIFEGRTALEATNAKGDDLFTMNTLKECSKLLCKGLEGDLSKLAMSFWKAVSKHHPGWKTVDADTNAETLRAETMSFHAISLNALSVLGNYQHRKGCGLTWLKRLNQVNWSAYNPGLEGVCRFGGRITKNTRTAAALAAYFAQQMNIELD